MFEWIQALVDSGRAVIHEVRHGAEGEDEEGVVVDLGLILRWCPSSTPPTTKSTPSIPQSTPRRSELDTVSRAVGRCVAPLGVEVIDCTTPPSDPSVILVGLRASLDALRDEAFRVHLRKPSGVSTGGIPLAMTQSSVGSGYFPGIASHNFFSPSERARLCLRRLEGGGGDEARDVSALLASLHASRPSGGLGGGGKGLLGVLRSCGVLDGELFPYAPATRDWMVQNRTLWWLGVDIMRGVGVKSGGRGVGGWHGSVGSASEWLLHNVGLNVTFLVLFSAWFSAWLFLPAISGAGALILQTFGKQALMSAFDNTIYGSLEVLVDTCVRLSIASQEDCAEKFASVASQVQSAQDMLTNVSSTQSHWATILLAFGLPLWASCLLHCWRRRAADLEAATGVPIDDSMPGKNAAIDAQWDLDDVPRKGYKPTPICPLCCRPSVPLRYPLPPKPSTTSAPTLRFEVVEVESLVSQFTRFFLFTLPVTIGMLLVASIGLLLTQHVQVDALHGFHQRWMLDAEQGWIRKEGLGLVGAWWQHRGILQAFIHAPSDALGVGLFHHLPRWAVWIVQHSQAPALTALMVLFKIIYRWVSRLLLHFENHRTEAQRQRAHAVRMLLLLLVTHHAGPVYCLVFRRDMELTQAALWTVLIITQLIFGNATELATPLSFLWNKHVKSTTSTATGRMTGVRRRLLREWALPNHEGIVEDVAGIVHAFSFSLLYAPVLPVASLISFGAALLQLKIDTTKLAFSRSPRPTSRAGARSWLHAMWFLVALAAALNSGTVLLILAQGQASFAALHAVVASIRRSAHALLSSASESALQSVAADVLAKASTPEFSAWSVAFGTTEQIDGAIQRVIGAGTKWGMLGEIQGGVPFVLTATIVAGWIIAFLALFAIPELIPSESFAARAQRASQYVLEASSSTTSPAHHLASTRKESATTKTPPNSATSSKPRYPPILTPTFASPSPTTKKPTSTRPPPSSSPSSSSPSPSPSPTFYPPRLPPKSRLPASTIEPTTRHKKTTTTRVPPTKTKSKAPAPPQATTTSPSSTDAQVDSTISPTPRTQLLPPTLSTPSSKAHTTLPLSHHDHDKQTGTASVWSRSSQASVTRRRLAQRKMGLL